MSFILCSDFFLFSSILFLDSLKKFHSKQTYVKHIRKWLNCGREHLGKGKVNGEVHPFTNAISLLLPKNELFLTYLFALLIYVPAHDGLSSDCVLYQYHTKQINVTVAFLFAGTLMLCL